MTYLDYAEKRSITRNTYGRYVSYNDGMNTRPVKCFDLSSLGLGILADKCVSIGKKLKVEILTKNNVAVNLPSTVKWCVEGQQGWRVGLEFGKMLAAPMEVFI